MEGPWELPRGWGWARLGDLCQINPKHDGSIPAECPVTFVPMAAVSKEVGAIINPQIRKYGEVRKGYTHFQEGDVLFAKITPCMENGKVAIARGLLNGIGCGTTEFIVLRPSEGVLPEYIYAFVRREAFRNDAATHMTGTAGQLRVPVDYMREAPFPLAPLPEQRRIVAKIETLFERSRAARVALDRVPGLMSRLRQAALAKAFRGQNGEEGLPEGWKVVRLGEVCETASGGTPSRSTEEYYSGDVPWVKSGELGDGVVRDTEEKITKDALENSSAKIFPKGTLLIALYGATVGKLGLLDIDAATNQAVCGIFENKEVLIRDYLRFYLLSIRQELIKRSFGGAQPNISQSLLRDLEIPLAPLPEQRRILSGIESLFSHALVIEAATQAAREQLERLDQATLAKAFRGALVERDPNDEPAKVPLERMRTRTEAPHSRARGKVRGRASGLKPENPG